ncbi:MAG: hypothetical protein KC621_09500 [Myxococcales bacterium]|nr:hypothetical protein [Myxococcales bacterium]
MAPGGGGPPAARGPAPFADYGPDARQMAGGLEGSRSQSRGVLAIVGGLLFMAASTFVILFAVLLVMLWWTANQRTGELANGEDGPQHIRDTGFADPTRTVRTGPGPRNPGDPGDGSNRDPNFIPPGPSTVIVSRDMMFHSIEINCPGGYRSRGRFKNVDAQMMSATVQNVPGDESCVVTFQGSEPAKTYIRGNERKICKFNPVECYMM